MMYLFDIYTSYGQSTWPEFGSWQDCEEWLTAESTGYSASAKTNSIDRVREHRGKIYDMNIFIVSQEPSPRT